MLFYWFIQFIKKIKWLFALPPVQNFVKHDSNAKCPCCGANSGKLRCVLMAKPGPVAKGRPQRAEVFCQHRCDVCGARWHDPAIRADATPETVLQSVARDEIESKEDRMANLQMQTPV